MHILLLIILLILVFDALLQGLANHLNVRQLNPELPVEFQGWYDAEKYRTSQDYLRTTTRFAQVHLLTGTLLLAAFLLAGGFGWADHLARAAGAGVIITGLIFTGLMVLLSMLWQLPFEVFSTFGIEERYGFNRTTAWTFLLDRVKSAGLMILLGGPLLAGILWFLSTAESWGWLIAWVAVAMFQLIMLLLAPTLILPLFNTFTPLGDGELRQAIEAYAKKEQVELSGIYSIDGSRRSGKTNAYVSGLGRMKRIALFDTLIEKHTVPELVAVLAHEVGHIKLGHIPRMMILSLLCTGAQFYLLSLFISMPGLYAAIGVSWPETEPAPIYAGIVAFGLLMAPINRLLSIYIHHRSRGHEFEADAYAARSTGDPGAMVNALRKLAVENLSNVAPHPLLVWLEYSHPPVLARIRALQAPAARKTAP